MKFLKYLFICAMLVHSTVWADTDIEGKQISLFACEQGEDKVYGMSINDGPGKCTLLPAMKPNWLMIQIAKDFKLAFYVDLQSIKWNGTVAELWVGMLKADSSKAAFTGPNSMDQFDIKAHRFYYCETAQQRSDIVEIYKNLRTNPSLVTSVKNDLRPKTSVDLKTSVDGIIYQLVCSRKYESMLTLK